MGLCIYGIYAIVINLAAPLGTLHDAVYSVGASNAHFRWWPASALPTRHRLVFLTAAFAMKTAHIQLIILVRLPAHWLVCLFDPDYVVDLPRD
jgi:hypothetical protein